MGLMSKRYIPHCCLVHVNERNNYLTKIIKCDEELIIRDIGSINAFKEKIEKGELLEKDMSFYERSQNGDEIYIWECTPMKNRFDKYIYGDKPIDIFFGIGEGRVYVEEGRFNTEDEGKRKLLNINGYLIDNPNYRFKEYEKDINLFRCCKLG